mmetsp:Transcript_36627/g.105540  ORF Transcript_36627/g.105540 Transcript_36627/m.105540 type:complete len:353 (-) Transcript_36627:838-1896(-)
MLIAAKNAGTNSDLLLHESQFIVGCLHDHETEEGREAPVVHRRGPCPRRAVRRHGCGSRGSRRGCRECGRRVAAGGAEGLSSSSATALRSRGEPQLAVQQVAALRPLRGLRGHAHRGVVVAEGEASCPAGARVHDGEEASLAARAAGQLLVRDFPLAEQDEALGQLHPDETRLLGERDPTVRAAAADEDLALLLGAQDVCGKRLGLSHLDQFESDLPLGVAITSLLAVLVRCAARLRRCPRSTLGSTSSSCLLGQLHRDCRGQVSPLDDISPSPLVEVHAGEGGAQGRLRRRRRPRGRAAGRQVLYRQAVEADRRSAGLDALPHARPPAFLPQAIQPRELPGAAVAQHRRHA